LNLAGLKFDRLSVRAGVGDFTVQRSFPGQLWRLSYPRQARTDSGLVQQVLQQLQTLRVDQFVSDTPGGDLEPYGLQTPEVSVVFGLGTNNLLTVEFGKSPTNNPMQIFARRSTYSNIVIVPRQILDLLRRPYTDFLDKRLLEFAPAAVDRIEVQAAESFALQKQANGAWRIAEPYQAPADPALVKGFLDRLNSIQIVDLVKEVVTESPVRQYILQTSSPVANTNQLLARIDFGTNQADKIFVRRIDENSVYSTRLEESQLLPQAAFELRDRRVWSFTTNQATGITITFNSKTYKLKRNSSGQWAFAPGSQGIINTFALEEAVFRLGQQLWSKHWVARNDINRARFGFSDPPHRLSIEVNNGDKPGMLTVEFGIQSPSGGPFALVDLDGGSTVFEFPFEIFHVYSEVVRGLTATASATP